MRLTRPSTGPEFQGAYQHAHMPENSSLSLLGDACRSSMFSDPTPFMAPLQQAARATARDTPSARRRCTGRAPPGAYYRPNSVANSSLTRAHESSAAALS